MKKFLYSREAEDKVFEDMQKAYDKEEKEMPEWFRNLQLEISLEIQNESTENRNLEYWFDKMWQELSRPENLAKIQEVRDLIEAIDYHLSDTSYGDDTATDNMYAALKPFQGGSDE